MRAVQMKNISAAARSLHLTPAAASHRIMQLENRIGARLLNRTTRALHPTEEGLVFYEHALEVLEAIERAESSIATAGGEPIGALRVTAPIGFGRRILGPLIVQFHERYPKVRVNLRLSDRLIDLLDEAVDIAIRMANPVDSSFIARNLEDCERVLCASPDYLDRKGRPREPGELIDHNCLVLRFPGSPQVRWRLQAPDGVVAVPATGDFDADEGDVLTEWALHGGGIVMKPYWEVAEHIRSGNLEVVLADYPPEPVKLMLMYPHRNLVPAKLRVFIDFMAEQKSLLPDVSHFGGSGKVVRFGT
ncbi:carbonate dehydratase [Novosphingobium pentaromativorans US6-1]|uniref:Carbonate dehydratase n=1 Tax=Novosphingobium pentaromativorans US6-1 TaxID=1088721 RepID=G6EEP1_9SPHN|nr:carbonate dehydratase [Novosphingobium pentaromativorans US6-1]